MRKPASQDLMGCNPFASIARDGPHCTTQIDAAKVQKTVNKRTKGTHSAKAANQLNETDTAIQGICAGSLNGVSSWSCFHAMNPSCPFTV